MRRIGLVFAGRNMAGATHKVWCPMLAPSPETAETNIRHLGRRKLRIPGHSWDMLACCDVFIRLKAFSDPSATGI